MKTIPRAPPKTRVAADGTIVLDEPTKPRRSLRKGEARKLIKKLKAKGVIKGKSAKPGAAAPKK